LAEPFLSSENKELKINIDFGTQFIAVPLVNSISSNDGLEAITCRFIRKTMDMWEGITIQNCLFYFFKNAEIEQVGDYFLFHEITGIKGTLVGPESTENTTNEMSKLENNNIYTCSNS
jgi:hypothetical protein